MNNQNQGASIEAAERAIFEEWVASCQTPYIEGAEWSALEVKKAWLIWQAARRTPAATTGDGELPPLPRAAYYDRVSARMSGEGIGFTAEQMRNYARAAIEADRAQRKQAALQELADIGQEIEQGAPSLYAATAADWAEDFAHENGNYENRCTDCGIGFMGHKRRTFCKVCAGAAPASAQPAVLDALRDARQFIQHNLVALHKVDAAIALLEAGAQPDQRESAAVPRVPTSEMIRAGMRYFHDKRYPATEAWRCYKDMLAAAPSPAAQPVAKDEACAWTEHPEDGYWRTACGRDWVIIDGTPTDHDMQHCHGCGKKLVQGQDSANNGAEN